MSNSSPKTNSRQHLSHFRLR
ncbi:hypothetical protein PENNAL_c0183G03800 [Penicillium nalgiovense]|uniref:Uncharacterized protein n=1 Tax=Penicillium nalgiovense TaxID=60175 RepID=A0A1V6WUR6_PENNA|nr:hypothetical protein PENNAL_c0183G03800 [Penicillium nalgiovense]